MKVLQILVLIFGFTVIGNAQKAVLIGTVYDANGAVIVNARVTAINQKGEKFEAFTNTDGIYILNLPFNLYDTKNTKNFRISTYEIIAEAKHFERFVLKDFKFVPAWNGKMNLDIALDVMESNNCEPGGCLPMRESIKTTEAKISDKISLKPLEELPKETNNTKRKNKNNKQ